MQHPPHDHPIDILTDCAGKAAFLADALAGCVHQTSHDLSPRGLQGLGLYLTELERDLACAATLIERKEMES